MPKEKVHLIMLIKMINANVKITHNRLVTLENQTSMMPALKDLNSEVNNTNA